MPQVLTSRSAAAIEAWLCGFLAEHTDASPRSINPAESFHRIGVSSLLATKMSAALSEVLGKRMPPSLIWSHPTPAELAAYLSGEHQTLTDATSHDVGAERLIQEPVAVVGMACRFPGARDLFAFWELLRNGREGIVTVPADRWDWRAYYHPDRRTPGKTVTREGGFIDQVMHFDPAFFGISPREAEEMDPQQRLALIMAWHAVEDAGLTRDDLLGSQTGVYMGAIWHDYADLLANQPRLSNLHSGTGQANNLVANRISYTFGLQGPSLVVDTACSSSLVALHLACRDLRDGTSDLALAGGVNLMLNPATTVALSQFGGLAPDNRCKAFDASADGFGRGEGAAVLVLKRLSRARVDGDRIYGLIYGHAVNNDGPSNGLTAPNPRAQARVIRAACQQAGVSPEDVDYVEAHGAGTSLGDPIEAQALAEVYTQNRNPAAPSLVIGSVKTNCGHLEGAAGVAGVVKTLLALYFRQLPPSLHFRQPNPHIPFEDWRLSIQTKLSPWPRSDHDTLFAGVSSFGWGGTNAHMILGSPPASAPRPVVLAGADLPTLAAKARSMADSIENRPTEAESREGVIGVWSAFDGAALQARLASGEPDRLWEPLRGNGSRVFVFSPQGGHWAGMGLTLLAEEPAFQAAFTRFDRAFQKAGGPSLKLLLEQGAHRRSWDRVSQVQPLTVAIQVALAQTLVIKGILPDLVIGHSLGEISAAWCAGILTMEEAALTIYHYSRHQARTDDEGGMALVGLPAASVQTMLDSHASELVIAGYNGPATTVVSGERQPLAEFVADVSDKGHFARLVDVNVAAHSSRIDAIAADLERDLSALRPRAPYIPMISTLTGEPMTTGMGGADYWPANLRQPVRFLQAVKQSLESGATNFIEVHPHGILLPGLTAIFEAESSQALAYATLHQGEHETAMLNGLVALQTAARTPESQCVTDSNQAWWLLSSHSHEALVGQLQALHDRCTSGIVPVNEASADLITAISGAQAPRCHHPERTHRLALCLTDVSELPAVIDAVERMDLDESPAILTAGQSTVVRGNSVRATGRPVKLAFLFGGQGGQWQGMGRRLYRSSRLFRRSIDRVDQACRPFLNRSIADDLNQDLDPDRYRRVDVVQPLIFAIQVALTDLLQDRGLVPDGVAGHSMGETAAAYAAGAIDLADAAQVICERSRLMHRASGAGAMIATDLPADEAAKVCDRFPRMELAVINGPRSTVLSGDAAEADRLIEDLEQRGVYCKRVQVDLASHGPHMDPLLPPLREALAGVRATQPLAPVYSTVTGRCHRDPDLDVTYWVDNLRQPVQFQTAIEQMLTDGFDMFLEVGPHPVLLYAVRQIGEAMAPTLGHRPETVGIMQRDQDDHASFYQGLAVFHALGGRLRPECIHPAGTTLVDGLPGDLLFTKPLIHPRLQGGRLGALQISEQAYDLPGRRLALAHQPDTLIWQTDLTAEEPGYLNEHRFEGACLVPAAWFWAALRAARADWLDDENARAGLFELQFHEALLVDEREPTTVQMVVEPLAADGRRRFSFFSRRGGAGPWTRHLTGRIQERRAEAPVEALPDVAGDAVDVETVYRDLAARGLDYGPAFQAVQQLNQTESACRGLLKLPAMERPDGVDYPLHPALLDACFQVMLTHLLPAVDPADLFITNGMTSLVIYETDDEASCRQLVSRATFREGAEGDDLPLVDIRIWNEQGRVMGDITGIRVHRVKGSRGSAENRSQSTSLRDFLPSWQAAPADERQPLLVKAVRRIAAAVLRLDWEKVPMDVPFQNLGMSSLMTLEMRGRLERLIQQPLSATLIWNYPTLAQVTHHLTTLLTDENPKAGPGIPPAGTGSSEQDSTSEPTGEADLLDELNQLETLLKEDL